MVLGFFWDTLYTYINGMLRTRELSKVLQTLSPPQRLLLTKSGNLQKILKKRGRGKGGKKGKAEKRERRKKRERKGKAKKASARFLSKYGARRGGGCALRCLHAGLWN